MKMLLVAAPQPSREIVVVVVGCCCVAVPCLASPNKFTCEGF